MKRNKCVIGLGLLVVCCWLLVSCGQAERKDKEMFREYSSVLMKNIFRHFQSTSCPCGRNLFYEKFPHSHEPVTYYVDGDSMKHEQVAFLWPTSAVFSGMNALYQATSSADYLDLLENTIVPIIECYRDTLRLPQAFQSYPVAFGVVDRYYEDNCWIGLDFLNLYEFTGKQSYLDTTEAIWEFLRSGYDDVLGGGIYWCEQKRFTKNVCSNAPVVVLSSRLYLATSDEKYLKAAKEHYVWIKNTFRDPEDGLYTDKIYLDGSIDPGKYSYNCGQMLQAASLLYKITKDETYLDDARNLVEACDRYFFFTSGEGKDAVRLLKNDNVWFAAIMLRGLEEFYRIDGNPTYINNYKETLKRLWQEGQDEYGFFADNRLSERSRYENEARWLLTQGALVELYAHLSAID